MKFYLKSNDSNEGAQINHDASPLFFQKTRFNQHFFKLIHAMVVF